MDILQKSVAAGEFKAKCLAILDEIAATGQSLVVTKRGKPVVKIIPCEEVESLAGSILEEGDLLSPIDAEWDALK